MERANYQSPAVSEGFHFARSLSSLNALIIVSMFDLIQNIKTTRTRWERNEGKKNDERKMFPSIIHEAIMWISLIILHVPSQYEEF